MNAKVVGKRKGILAAPSSLSYLSSWMMSPYVVHLTVGTELVMLDSSKQQPSRTDLSQNLEQVKHYSYLFSCLYCPLHPLLITKPVMLQTQLFLVRSNLIGHASNPILPCSE